MSLMNGMDYSGLLTAHSKACRRISELQGIALKYQDRIVELEAQNKGMVEALRKLRRVTAIDNSFNGPDKEKIG